MSLQRYFLSFYFFLQVGTISLRFSKISVSSGIYPNSEQLLWKITRQGVTFKPPGPFQVRRKSFNKIWIKCVQNKENLKTTCVSSGVCVHTWVRSPAFRIDAHLGHVGGNLLKKRILVGMTFLVGYLKFKWKKVRH